MSDVDIKYTGRTIATMDASGSKKILTAGKYLTDDVTIDYTKSGGSVVAACKDVNFIDYDGRIVASYSAAEFANLSELPPNPVHDGLIAQGWNWTLADAKAQVLISGVLDIGQSYITTDGKTRLYITIADNGRRTIRLYWSQTVARGVVIDWGDGSATYSNTGTGLRNTTHTYPDIGDYVITLTISSGVMLLGGTSTGAMVITGSVPVYRRYLRRIELGSNAGLNTYACYNTYGLESITIPKSVSQLGSFYSASSLRFLCIPSGLTSFAALRGTGSMQFVSIPKSVTTFVTNAFYGSQILRVSVPPISTIESGAFQSCVGLSKLVIPTTVTNIGANAFNGMTGIGEYHFKGTTPPALEDATVFTSIPTDCKIYVPNSAVATYKASNIWSDFESYIIGE